MSRFSLKKIPDGPGVYALYEHDQVILVGSAPDLRELAEQHLVGSRGPSADLREVIPHPERITKICWWQHAALADDGRRNAARAVAIEVLGPVNRPRFTLSSLGEVALADPEFVKSMEALFHGPPAGAFIPQTLDEMARSVYELEDRVAALERRLAEKG
jgi:hypothetical protein